MDRFEVVRKQFKPQTINVLFIAESPPDGGTFFYFENSNLYRAIKAGFLLAINKDIKINFLDFFKLHGCYLDDLCLKPVNKMQESQRIFEREQGIIPLSIRIKKYNPQVIIILMKGIENEVKKAIKIANLISLKYINTTSFPANSERNRIDCIQGISKVITTCISKKIIVI